jgi:hypothetical protein
MVVGPDIKCYVAELPDLLFVGSSELSELYYDCTKYPLNYDHTLVIFLEILCISACLIHAMLSYNMDYLLAAGFAAYGRKLYLNILLPSLPTKRF